MSVSCSSPSFICISDNYFAETEKPLLEKALNGRLEFLILDDTRLDPAGILEKIEQAGVAGKIEKGQKLLFSPLLQQSAEGLQKEYADMDIFIPVFKQSSREIAGTAAEAIHRWISEYFPEGDPRITLVYSREPYSKVLLAEALQELFEGNVLETRVVGKEASSFKVETPVLLLFCGDLSIDLFDSLKTSGGDLLIVTDRAGRKKQPGSAAVLHMDWGAVYAEGLSSGSTVPRWRFESLY